MERVDLVAELSLISSLVKLCTEESHCEGCAYEINEEAAPRLAALIERVERERIEH